LLSGVTPQPAFGAERVKGAIPMLFQKARLVLEEFEPRLVPTVYLVGPGRLYLTLHDVPWELVKAGDIVKVAYQTSPYQDKIALSNSGTASKPIVIEGEQTAAGQLPVLDADGAVENLGALYWSDQVAAKGVFTIAPSILSETVRWIHISGFEIENANRNHYFYNALGQLIWWGDGATAIALYDADHITIDHCIIHDNENGLYGPSYGSYEGNLHDITVQNCTIFNNGVVGEDHYYNTYLEAIGMTYQFNHFGPTLDGSLGANVKDRSAGLVFRYNNVEGGAILLDLVEPAGGGQSFLSDPLFGTQYVYGNILYNPPYGAGTLVLFGGDNGNPAFYQRNLYFYDNTVVNRNDEETGRWRTILFECPTNVQTVYAQNNIFFNMPETPGSWAGNWCIADSYGTFYLGANWINRGYLGGRDGGTFQGTIQGEDQLLTGNNPWFVDPIHQDFRLQSGSRCLGAGQPLLDDEAAHPVEYQYDYATGTWVQRTSINDLGAIE
jgi:hypothetical protein